MLSDAFATSAGSVDTPFVAALEEIAEQLRIANVIAYTTRDGFRPNATAATEIERGLRIGGQS